MATSPASGGRGRTRRDDRAAGSSYADPLDGRLDLDHLDDATPLDVLGDDVDDRPLLSERIRDGLERSGVLPWIRRHRALAAGIAAAAAVAVVVAGVWWEGRPKPMADPRVSVTTGGNEPARLILDASTGLVTAITQLVLVRSDEPTGTTVDTVGVEGPGLQRPQSRVITAQPGDTVTGAVTSQVECSTEEASTAVARAHADDYVVRIRRTSALGEVREDTVPLSGSEEWLSDVRSSCVQIAAERDLEVQAVDVRPVDGVIATDVRLQVHNSSDQPWSGMRVSTDAGPTIVANGQDVDIAPGQSAWVPVRLWPDDCTDPVAPLAQGVPLRAAIGDQEVGLERLNPSFTLPLSPAELDTVAAALRSICTATPPTSTIVRARVAGGTTEESAGTLTMYVDVTAPGAFLVEVQTQPPDARGLVTPFETPTQVVDGVARIHLTWVLPQCFDLLSSGAPELSVRLVADDVRRPYLLRLHGDPLRLNVDRLCGSTVASVVR
ncbi:MAG: hypothetical protein AB7O74_06585 [Candidatus Nanopelagicales bacterium]